MPGGERPPGVDVHLHGGRGRRPRERPDDRFEHPARPAPVGVDVDRPDAALDERPGRLAAPDPDPDRLGGRRPGLALVRVGVRGAVPAPGRRRAPARVVEFALADRRRLLVAVGRAPGEAVRAPHPVRGWCGRRTPGGRPARRRREPGAGAGADRERGRPARPGVRFPADGSRRAAVARRFSGAGSHAGCIPRPAASVRVTEESRCPQNPEASRAGSAD